MLNTSSAGERLAQVLAAYHDRLRGLPFKKAMVRSELPVASYGSFLQAIRLVHGVLEPAWSAADDPVVRAAWSSTFSKTAVLDEDLESLGVAALEDNPAAQLRAIVAAEEALHLGRTYPSSYLGSLFALATPKLWEPLSIETLPDFLNMPGPGSFRYLESFGSYPAGFWEGFGTNIEQSLPAGAAQDHAAHAARSLLEGLAGVVAVLYPPEEATYRELVSALNPEAGAHAITDDPIEIQAAIRAGRTSLQHFPYYEWRYGERGKQFTQSDSAWIVTLTRYPAAVVARQLTWLGKLLAYRGMPRWLLEEHLRLLAAELIAARPERADGYQKLSDAANEMRQARRVRLKDSKFQTLGSEFEAEVAAEWDDRMRGIGAIIAAAVVDEKDGVRGAVSSLTEWLTDSEHFGESWIEAVHRAVARARSAVG